MSRVTLRERFFPLHQPDDVDGLLLGVPWCVIFKAGTSEKTFDAWLVAQQVLEPRVDVALGFIRLPEDRPASERVTTLSGIVHRSPQLILFHDATARGHLDEFAIVPDQLVPLLRERLPVEVGPPVRNQAVVTLEPYRVLLSQFLERCDRVKFAGYRPDAEESLATLGAARGFVEDTRLRQEAAA